MASSKWVAKLWRKVRNIGLPLGSDGFDVARFLFEHVAIEKQKRPEGLVLRGIGDVFIDR